jgi:hypothetical protein
MNVPKLSEGEELWPYVQLPCFDKWPFVNRGNGCTATEIVFLSRIQEANRHQFEQVPSYGPHPASQSWLEEHGGEMTDEEEHAAIQALRAFQKATDTRRRAKIWADPDTEDGGVELIDVTESVVDVMDMVVGSMDWGSGFYSDTDKLSIIALARLLKVDLPEEG